MALVGKYAFLVGLVIAVAGGVGFEQAWFGWVIAVLGLVVGFLNISDKESQTFLLAAIALIVATSAVGAIPLHRGGDDPDHREPRALPGGRGLGRRGEESVRGRERLKSLCRRHIWPPGFVAEPGAVVRPRGKHGGRRWFSRMCPRQGAILLAQPEADRP